MLLLFVLLIPTSFGEDFHHPKCCNSDSVLEKNFTDYSCVSDLEKRTQIVANSTDFLESGENGECVEVQDSVRIFARNNSGLFKVRDLEVEFFRKCCPLNYFYNSTSHGCVKSKTLVFFKEKFVKVGLPECKIIEDFENTTEMRNFQHSIHCIDKDQNNVFVVRVCRNSYEEVCDRIRCIHKCCPDGQSFVNGSHCRNTYIHGLDFSAFSERMDNITDNFAVVHDGFTGPIYPLYTNRFFFHLDSQGIFTMTEADNRLEKVNVTRHYSVDQRAYCVEHAVKNSRNLNYVFFRNYPSQSSVKFTTTGIAMAISCCFLALTILYYCVSDEKNTLFGKILISYCSALILALFFLSYLGLNVTRPAKGAKICTIVGYLIFYMTLAVMNWMNVMCIDIYCTFGTSRSFFSHQHKKKEIKRFLWYCLHGWGTPIVLTTIPMVLNEVKVLPRALQLVIKEETCFIQKGNGNYAEFLFSTIPIAILQICNLILFIKTTLYCWQVKKEISKINDNQEIKGEKRQKFNKFRDRFGLLLKLFFIMGISFLFEVVSTFFDFKKNTTTAVIEVVWDTFNSLQGVFIFIIFILKRRIFNKFKKKIGLKKLRKISLVSSGTTQTTSLPTLNKNNL